MTRGEVVFEVARSFGLSDDPVSEDNPADELILMQRWVNASIIDILVKTRCFLDESDMTLAAGDTDYRIDEDILAVDMVRGPTGDPNIMRRLTSIPQDTLEDMLQASVSAPTYPAYYFNRGDMLRVAPAPQDTVTLRYFYVPKPTKIPADGTTGSDAFDLADATYGGIPEEYHDAAVMYCLWKAAQYDDKGGGFYRGHAFAPGSAYQAIYEDRIKEIRKELRGKAGRGMHAGRVGYPDRSRFVPNRNDIYPGWTSR